MVDDRLRIVFVAHTFFPSVGGAQARARKQAHRLRALGHEVTVLTLRLHKRWKRTEILDGFPVVRLGGFYASDGELRAGRLGHFLVDIRLFCALWRLRQSYDVMHVFQLSSLAGAAALAGRLLHKPVIVSIACEGPDEAQVAQLARGAMLMADTLTDTSSLRVDAKDVVLGELAYLPRVILGGQAIVNSLRRSNAFYQVLSTRCRSYLASRGFRDERIVHISGSVDTEKFRPAPRPDAAAPERDVLCVARLEYSKGIDVLLHAWGRMLAAPAEWRATLNIRLRIVGDGALRPQMMRIAEGLGIADSVEFLGSRTDIADLAHRSWSFVLPSRWEGMPNALLEAMACGLPSVATRVSGSEDIITDGVNGLLVEPERPIELGQALRRIIEDADLAQRLGQEGRATVVQRYQLHAVVEQCLALYRRLLGRRVQGNDEEAHPYAEPFHAGALED